MHHLGLPQGQRRAASEGEGGWEGGRGWEGVEWSDVSGVSGVRGGGRKGVE